MKTQKISLRGGAGQGAKWTGLASSVKAFLEIVRLIVLARLLDPSDFGLMAMAVVILAYGQTFADMGVSNAIVYRQDTSAETLSSLYWATVVSGAAVCVAMWTIAPLATWFYGESELTRILVMSSLIFLITPVGQQFHFLLQKYLRFRELAMIDISASLVAAIVAIWAAVLGAGVYALVVGQVGHAIVRTALLSRIGFREWSPRFHFRRTDLRGYLSFGLYQMGERSINYFSINLDKLLIGVLLGSHALGIYHIAYQLVMRPFQLFNPVITRVAFPVFSLLSEDGESLRQAFLEVTRVIAMTLFPVYALMIVLADPLLPLLVGEKWSIAVPVFQVLGVLGLFYSIGNPVGSLLLSKGRADLGFYVNLLRLIAYACAIWLGADKGVLGVAIALVLATGLLLFPVGFLVRWMLVQLRPAIYISAFAPFLALSVVVAVASWHLKRLDSLLSSPLEIVIVPAFAGLLLYVGGLLLIQRPLVDRVRRAVMTR